MEPEQSFNAAVKTSKTLVCWMFECFMLMQNLLVYILETYKNSSNIHQKTNRFDEVNDHGLVNLH